jgi:3',5'-cyclic-AMP phosphodiesterase
LRTTSRRQQLKALGLGALAGTVGMARPLSAASTLITARRVLRIAQITDIHVQPELGAADGMTQCLRHIHAQTDPVDLILNTGDCVMDCMAQDADRTKLVWDLWDQILASECKLPIHHLIGNHDVWGWSKKASRTTGDEPGWGKGVALKRLGLKSSYYSFDQADWHFIALDAVQPYQEFYLAGLEDDQFEWLRRDLAATDPAKPILIFSHIPIISAAALMKKDIATNDKFVVPGGKMFLDNVAVKNLLRNHPNVKLCISGHIHLRDRVEYMGLPYLCNGAVCGDYWKGNSDGECDPGYTLIDLFENGTFAYQYVPYGWSFRVAEQDH